MAQRSAAACKVTQWLMPGSRFKYVLSDYSFVAFSAVVQMTPVVRSGTCQPQERWWQDESAFIHTSLLVSPLYTYLSPLQSCVPFGILYGKYSGCIERFKLKSSLKNWELVDLSFLLLILFIILTFRVWFAAVYLSQSCRSSRFADSSGEAGLFSHLLCVYKNTNLNEVGSQEIHFSVHFL